MRKKERGLLRRMLVLCLVIAMLLTDASLAFAAEDPGTVTEAETAGETAVTAEDGEALQTEGPAEETPEGEAPAELPESDPAAEPAEEPVDTEEPAETPAADAEEPAEMPEEPAAGPEIPSETPAKVPVSNAGAAEAGRFAFAAMDTYGILIGPEMVEYAEGMTIKDALLAMDHEFLGLEDDWITAIDGSVDNYYRYYDGGAYDLDAGADEVKTAFVISARETMTDTHLALVKLLAEHKERPAEEQAFAAVKTAYEAAKKGLLTADEAGAESLAKALTDAYAAYAAWLAETPASVTFDAAYGTTPAASATVSMTDQNGCTVTGPACTAISALSGTYDYTVTDGRNEVTGTLTLTEGETKTVAVPMPEGEWFGELIFRAGSGTSAQVLTSERAADGSRVTLYLPDSIVTPYLYLEPGAGLGTDESLWPDYRAFSEHYSQYGNTATYYGDESKTSYRIPWKSNAKSLYQLAAYGLAPAATRLKVVRQNGDQVQRQYLDVEALRVPTLKSLTAEEPSGTKLSLGFTQGTGAYTLTTLADSVVFRGSTFAKNSYAAYGTYAEGYGIYIDGALLPEDGSLTVPVENGQVLTVAARSADGQSDEYRITIRKIEATRFTVTKEAGVSATLVNPEGSVIYPTSQTDTEALFDVAEGEYTLVGTLEEEYHTGMAVTVSDSSTSAALTTPVKEKLLTSLQAANTSNLRTALIYGRADAESFDWEDHEVTFLVPDFMSQFYLHTTGADTGVSFSRGAYTNISGSTVAAAKATTYTSSLTANTQVTGFLSSGGNNNAVTFTVSRTAGDVTYYQDYRIRTQRSLSLAELAVKDESGNAIVMKRTGTETAGFDSEIFDYTMSVPQAMDEATLSVVFSGATQTEARVGGYTLTCGETVLHRIDQSNAPQSFTVTLDPYQETETVLMTLSHDEESDGESLYRLTFVKQPPVTVTIDLEPEDGNLFITDLLSGRKVDPNRDGTYTLMKNSGYSYTATAVGYVGETQEFMPEDEMTLTVRLTEAPVNETLPTDMEASWPFFRYDQNNNGAVPYALPTDPSQTTLYWANQLGAGYSSGATGCPILAGGYLYTYAGSHIFRVDSMTGEVLAVGEMDRASAFAINSPAFSDGMIFVGLSNGGVQAFDAMTLESLWLYNDPKKGQPNCPITVNNGYVYTGFWNSEASEANFVCLTETDEDPTQPKEAKLAAWTYTGDGFYWAGSYVGYGSQDQMKIDSGNAVTYVLVGSDDGSPGSDKGCGTLLSLDQRSGAVIDAVTDVFPGDIRSSVMYDPDTDRYYFTTRGGYFCSVALKEDGTFDHDTIKTPSLQSNTAGGTVMSTSTPVIHNHRAYVGVSGSKMFGAYSGHNITVIDLDRNRIAYTAPTQGYPQTSGLLTTAYGEDGKEYVYVYFFDNYTPGKLRYLRDCPGQTAAEGLVEETYEAGGGDTTVTVASTLFTPFGKQAQYAICSPIADEYGNIYFKNDSAYMMMIGATITSLDVTALPERTAYVVGDTFDPAGMVVTATYANGKTRDVSRYVSYTTEPLTADDTEITISFNLGANMTLYHDVDGEAGKAYVPPQASVDITFTSLEQIKTDALAGLETLADPADYRTAEQAELASILEAARAAVNSAGSTAEVDAAVRSCKEQVAALKTDAQYAAEEAAALEASKTAAKEDLAAYAAALAESRELTAEEQAALAAVLAEAENAVDGCGTLAEVEAAVTDAKARMEAAIGGMLAAPEITAAGNVSAGSKITWSAVAGAESYTLSRDGEEVKSGITGTSFTVPKADLESGRSYAYTVCAVSGAATSDWSAEKPLTYMAAPTITKTRNVNAGIEVTWDAVDGAKSYIVMYKKDGGSWATYKEGVTAAKYVAPKAKLASGTKYWFTIKSVAADGTASGYTGGKAQTYMTTPAVTKTRNVNAGIEVTWDKVTGATSYILMYKTDGGSWKTYKSGITATKFVVPKADLKSGIKYWFTVKAKGAATSGYSSGKAQTYMTTPVVKSATKVSSGVKVTWGSVTGATSYIVMMKVSGGSWTTVKSGVTGTSYTVPKSKLTSGKTYYFTVKAKGAATSGYSSGKSLTYKA